jgi:hypothetical protein
MRCSEARQRLIESCGAVSDGADDRDLRRHLKTCPDCALFAQAERALRGDLGAATADDNTDNIPLSALKTRVEAKAAEKTIWRRIMSQIENQLNTRPRLLAGLGIALVAFLFVTLVPFSTTHIVGYNVSLAGVDPESKISPNLLAAAITAIGYENASVTLASTEESNDYTITNLPTEEEARAIASAFADAIDYEGEAEIEAVVQVSEEPLYVQVAGIVKRVETEPLKIQFKEGKIIIDGEEVAGTLQSRSTSDEDVKIKIEKLLDGLGVDDADVFVESTTDSVDGTRTVTIQMANGLTMEANEDMLEVYISDDAVGAIYDEDGSRIDEKGRVVVELPVEKKLDGRGVVLKVKLKEDDN